MKRKPLFLEVGVNYVSWKLISIIDLKLLLYKNTIPCASYLATKTSLTAPLVFWPIFCDGIDKFSWWLQHQNNSVSKHIKISKIGAMLRSFFPARGLYYKTFYGRNLQIFVIS